MVPVRKPDGKVRLCIDYRKLNVSTLPDPYEIPLIGDLLQQVGDSCFLSKLDLNKGFYQVGMAEMDIPKTAFCTPWGKFEFTRMPFGLRNAPATFQWHITEVLRGLESFTGAYIDDVVIFSKTWKEHLGHIRQTLTRLRENGLTAKPDKCTWGRAEIEYLGHRVGHRKISIPECRVEAIQNFERPVTKRDMRAFLGTAGYYQDFSEGLLSKTGLLTDATKKAAPNRIKWTEKLCESFNDVRKVLSNSSALVIPRSDDTFVLQTDASKRGLGAVLCVLRDGKEEPTGYFSRKLTDVQTRYTATELECLAIVKAIEHFEVYLTGRHFTIETDHRALQFLQSARHLNGRLTRWALRLQMFTYQIPVW